MTEQRLRIAVIGVGAVGGYFGGQLAHAGVDVVFVARQETLRRLRASGLKVESPRGDLALKHVQVTDEIASVGLVDVVIVAVKAWQVPEVAQGLGPLLGPDTAILPLQNGIEAVEQLAGVCGKEHVLGGTCRIVAQQVEPGRIRDTGVEPFIALGELDDHRSPRAVTLVETLQRAGIACHIPENIQTSIWKKFMFIAPVSGVGSVARVPLGALRTQPETRALIEQAAREVEALAHARQVPLPANVVEQTLAFLDGVPAEATTSMQRDVMTGRISELEALNGAVVRAGRATEVATPVNAFLYAALLPQEVQARRVSNQSRHPRGANSNR